MTLVWVTGLSGTGKSSVCATLKRQGCLAVDADWDGYCHWSDRLTGERADPSGEVLPNGWLDRFAWTIDVEAVRSLAAAAASDVAFLCGSVENEGDVWESFDRVVCLLVDDSTLQHRLATRTTNAFGKQPDQLAAVLWWNRDAEDRYRARGATLVDGTKPIHLVVRHVLAVGGLGPAASRG